MTAQSPEYASSVNHDTDNDELVVKLYDANHGKTKRTGGPYRDDVEREQAEIQRAKLEGREPDLENPGPSTGTQLVPASQLVERDVDKSHYSDSLAIENEPDPTQANWDNDASKVAALDAAVKFQELQDKANKPDSEPKDEFDV